VETETYYDILGLLPNASHRQVVRAFGELAGRFQPHASDPIARERFQQAKAAYQTLTNYESRLR
jgi:curved DNA-binding protein CbpA